MVQGARCEAPIPAPWDPSLSQRQILNQLSKGHTPVQGGGLASGREGPPGRPCASASV